MRLKHRPGGKLDILERCWPTAVRPFSAHLAFAMASTHSEKYTFQRDPPRALALRDDAGRGNMG